MSALTIVMYHYVRPISKSEFKGIKGLEIEGFERQLDYLEENFCIVDTEMIHSESEPSSADNFANLMPFACQSQPSLTQSKIAVSSFSATSAAAAIFLRMRNSLRS